MRSLKLYAFIIITLLLATSCSKVETTASNKQEVFEYSTKTFQIGNYVDLNISIDMGKVEIYTWNKKEIKFEAAKSIIGNKEKELLYKKLKDIQIEYKYENNLITYFSKYRGGIENSKDKSLALKIYLPIKTRNIKCKLDFGTIKFFDQINCNLNMEMNHADAEIDMIKGKVNVTSGRGEVRINNGELYPESFIKINTGNLNIKAALMYRGKYNFEIGTGNISLALPKTSKVFFENLGTFTTNEFISQESPTSIRLVTDMGRIIVKKY